MPMTPEDARILAGAMLDESAARQAASANAPIDLFTARMRQAWPSLATFYPLAVSPDGFYAIMGLPGGVRVRVRPASSSGNAWLLQAEPGGYEIGAADETEALAVLARIADEVRMSRDPSIVANRAQAPARAAEAAAKAAAEAAAPKKPAQAPLKPDDVRW
jgi:hypothetical protein